MFRILLLAAMLAAMPVVADEPTPAPDGVELYFISPSGGAVIEGPVRVVFGLRGMGIAPAGVAAPHTGHHHLLVNTGLTDLASPIPADDRHIHFGAGQTETVLELAPGTHTLQLVLGDHLHRPHDPPVMSEPISITVR